MTNTVSPLYIFTHDNVVHGAPGEFNVTSACGLKSDGDMTCVYTPAQAAYWSASPAVVASDIIGTVCPICFP
jgi:hypothetical protein